MRRKKARTRGGGTAAAVVATGKTVPVAIEDELKRSYLTYAMSVIVSRALPEVRDGLKPVHRRILHGMWEMGLRSNVQTRKCAAIVGDVMGKYHPHGDLAIYDSLVRMAQAFSMRHGLVSGQGNFGSIDGDPPAAMRYTEARLARLAEEMLRDIDKETVDFHPNYDETTEEPDILPAAFPNLLVNGSSGIAVGMSTSIPPHNLKEVTAAAVALARNPSLPAAKLLRLVPGPDFPTGGIIYGADEIVKAYETGHGIIKVRAKLDVETGRGGKETIVVTEIPYAVNKSRLVAGIADLVNNRRIDGIADIRDESSREGMRILIELRRDANPQIVLNQLFKHTAMEQSFSMILLALVNGEPKVLTLRKILLHYVEHRREVVTRRTRHDLRKAEERAHILEGYIIALNNIDRVIRMIRASRTVEIAQAKLMKSFKLSEAQARAILEMRLQRLTGLERDKIVEELKSLKKLVKELREILRSKEKVTEIVTKEMTTIADRFGDARRTQIVVEAAEALSVEDLIHEEDMAITLSHAGYIKRHAVSAYRKQRRGGKGVIGAATKEQDFVEHIWVASTHAYLLFFTNRGKCYWMKVHEIPESSRTARGTNIRMLLNLAGGEEVTAHVDLPEFGENRVIMVTAMGMIKRCRATEFENAKRRGIIAIGLSKGDELEAVRRASLKDDVLMATRRGHALRIRGGSLRDMGRGARGVRGIRLRSGDEVCGMIVGKETGGRLFAVTRNGFGKRVNLATLRRHTRGTGGQIYLKTDARTGEVDSIGLAQDGDEIMVITAAGMVVRTPVKGIPVLGRAAKGVRVVRVEPPDIVVSAAVIVAET